MKFPRFPALGICLLLQVAGDSAMAQAKILIDLGRDGNWRSLSTPGNWNSLDASAYWTNLTDSAGAPTPLDFGFVAGAVGGMDSFNGPAGDTSLDGAPTYGGFNPDAATNAAVDPAALGELARNEAVFDYFTSSVFVVNQLDPALTYRLTFFGSHKYNTAATTVFTAYDSDPGDVANANAAGVVAAASLYVNDGPVNGNAWQHNTNRVAELTISNLSSVHIGFVDADGSSPGYLNAMSIEPVLPPPPVPAVRTVLLDIGRSNADGGWYGGLTPTSPDANGNHWNTLDIGKYAGNMADKTNGPSPFGAGFLNTNNPVFGWYNGPAGDNTVAWTVDNEALGDLGNADAAFDYVTGTDIRLAVDGLTAGKQYRLKFFCSRRWVGDQTTKITVYGDNTFDPAVQLAEGTVSNRSATQGWVHNADTLLTLDHLTASGTSLFINIAGGEGGAGTLNAMSIEELPVPPPVITSTTNGSGTVGQNFTYAITASNAPDSFGASPLPAGLSVDPATGVISGMPAMAGDFSLELTASNASGSATNAITVSIAKGVSTIQATGPGMSSTTGSAGLVTYSYQGTGTTAYGPTDEVPTSPGDYEVIATVAADANWESATSAPYNFTVSASNPFTVWLAGRPADSANLLKFAVGGASSPDNQDGLPPIKRLTATDLELSVVVRTNGVAVAGATTTDLASGPWVTTGVTYGPDQDQTGVPQGHQRRTYRVSRGGAAEKFLRLTAELSP